MQVFQMICTLNESQHHDLKNIAFFAVVLTSLLSYILVVVKNAAFSAIFICPG